MQSNKEKPDVKEIFNNQDVSEIRVFLKAIKNDILQGSYTDDLSKITKLLEKKNPLLGYQPPKKFLITYFYVLGWFGIATYLLVGNFFILFGSVCTAVLGGMYHKLRLNWFSETEDIIVRYINREKNLNQTSKVLDIATNTNSVADELKKLNELKREGVLTEDEFQNEKKKLLAS